MKLRLNLWVKNGNILCGLQPTKHQRVGVITANEQIFHNLWVKIDPGGCIDELFHLDCRKK